MSVQHGTSSGYNYHKCRCDKCKAYKAEHYKIYREKAKERFKLNPEKFEHGKESTYNAGCGCELCTNVVRTKVKKTKNKALTKTVPANKHGTNAGYDYWQCRCKACKNARLLYTESVKSND